MTERKSAKVHYVVSGEAGYTFCGRYVTMTLQVTRDVGMVTCATCAEEVAAPSRPGIELVPLEKRDDDMAEVYVLVVRSGGPLEPHEGGGVILLRGIEYGVSEPRALPAGGWTCRLADLHREEPPWREPISPVWNLGWKPKDWEGEPAVKPDVQCGDPRDPAVVAGQIFKEWMDRGHAASWNRGG